MNPTALNDTIVQEITIQAPAEEIFDALTNPQRLVQWWNVPGRFQMTHLESDLRPGGKRIMRGSGYGKPVTITGEYREIERPRLLVFTWLPDWQGDAVESVVRFEFEEKDGLTKVRLTHSGLTSEKSRESHRGWPQILAILQAHAERRSSS